LRNRRAFEKIRIRSLLVCFLVSFIVASILIAIIQKLTGLKEGEPLTDAILGYFLYSVPVVWILLSLKRVNLKIGDLIGSFYRKIRWIRIFFIVLFLVLFSYGAFWLLNYPLSYIVPSYVKGILEEKGFYTLADTSFPLLCNILNVVIVVIIAPIIEEIVFRGIILGRLSVMWNTSRAILLSSFIFGILHYDIIGAFIFGIIMSILYINTRTLVVPILCHVLNNSVAFGISALGVLAEVKSAYTLSDFRADLSIGITCLAISAPWVVYYLYKNWPKKSKILYLEI